MQQAPIDKSAAKQEILELKTEAKALIQMRRYVEARELLDKAITFSPNSYKLYRLRSLANACLDEFEQSVRDADHVIDLAPSCADGYYHKGCALYNLRDYAGAAHAFEEGLRLNPTDRILRQAFWDSVTLLTNGRKVQDETE